MERCGDYSERDAGPPHSRTEAAQVRSLLQLPLGSSTDDVLTAIQMLQHQNRQMGGLWEALTELLFLGPDTPPSDVLTTIALYVKEAQFLREQEQRHLFIIQKLQNDRRDILKRFHLSKSKAPSATKIREKAQFPRQAAAADDDDEELDILEDDQDSVADSHEARQRQLHEEMRARVSNGSINGSLWKLFDEVAVGKPKRRTTCAGGRDAFGGSLDSIQNRNERRNHVQGFIISKANPKAQTPADIRQNVTTGTKESTVEKYVKAEVKNGSEQGTSYQNITKPRLTSSAHPSKSEEGSLRKGFMICSEIHVPEKGGCYSLPDLGLNVSVPGGALPQGSTSERLVIGLLWDHTGPLSIHQMPIGPVLIIRPSGLPFKKPIVVSIQHNLTTASPHEDYALALQSTNLILMHQPALKSAEKWLPVASDPEDPYFTPLGFIADDNMVMFIKKTGKYTLVPSQSNTSFVPNSSVILVFGSYQKADTDSVLKLDVYCLEDNQANKKLTELLTQAFKQEVPPRHLITSRHLKLPGVMTFYAKLDDLIDGWSVCGGRMQAIDTGSLGQGHKPVAAFTLKHILTHLRCLLATLTIIGLNEQQHLPLKTATQESITLSIDLDQIEKSTADPLPLSVTTGSNSSLDSSNASKRSLPASERSDTFLTNCSDSKTGHRSAKKWCTATRSKPTNSSLLRMKVGAVKNEQSWIPDWVKSDLVREVKGEMYSADKWNNLLASLKMEYLDEILQQSVDPVFDLFSYCEVIGISVSKIKEVLSNTGFEDSANVLSSYLNQLNKK